MPFMIGLLVQQRIVLHREKSNSHAAIMSTTLLSVIVFAVSGFAIWQRSTVGWIVAAIANAVCVGIYWAG